MEDDSEVAMPESQITAVSSKSSNKGDEESSSESSSKQKKKVMTIGSTSIIPLKGSEVCLHMYIHGGKFKYRIHSCMLSSGLWDKVVLTRPLIRTFYPWTI